MLDVARENARQAGVGGLVEFSQADFFTFTPPEPFDYVILMGLMDYMREPRKVIEKVLSLSRSKAFFSFAADGGIVAWQRKRRFRNRCELYLYMQEQLGVLFSAITESRDG